MDDPTKARIRELMFHVVPDADEDITDDVLARSEAVDYEEGERLKSEFRSLIEALNEHPEARQTVLDALDEINASANESVGDAVEWKNVCDVMGRRIRRALEPLL